MKTVDRTKFILLQLGRAARTLLFLTIGFSVMALAFAVVFVPTFILSSIIFSLAAISALLYTDKFTYVLLKLGKNLVEALTGFEPDFDLNFNSFTNRGLLLLSTPLTSLFVASATAGTLSYIAAAKVAFTAIAGLDYLCAPFYKFMNVPASEEDAENEIILVDPDSDSDLPEGVKLRARRRDTKLAIGDQQSGIFFSEPERRVVRGVRDSQASTKQSVPTNVTPPPATTPSHNCVLQ